jgi:hypothetical protein
MKHHSSKTISIKKNGPICFQEGIMVLSNSGKILGFAFYECISELYEVFIFASYFFQELLCILTLNGIRFINSE